MKGADKLGALVAIPKQTICPDQHVSGNISFVSCSSKNTVRA
jgi:hypothetical protein